MSVQTALALSPSPWFELRDGDPRLRTFYNRHYSSRGSDSPQIVGPGRKLVLLTHAVDALFVWRKFIDKSDFGGGFNCAVFRNESRALSSALILAAELVVFARWGIERLYTYVNAARIRSANPGYCFLMAGWRRCGMTKGGHGRDPLVVLEKVSKRRPLIEIPVGGSVEVERAFRPGAERDPARAAASALSGFIVRSKAPA